MSQDPIKLDYEIPDEGGPVWRIPSSVQAAIGFGAYCALGAICLLICNVTGSIAGVLFLVPAAIVAAVLAHKNLRWPGFVAGFPIGVLVSCLAVGICFVAIL